MPDPMIQKLEALRGEVAKEQTEEYCVCCESFLSKLDALIASAREEGKPDDRIMVREAGGRVIGMAPNPASAGTEGPGSSHDDENTCGCEECERDREQESAADNASWRGEERYDREVQEGE